MDAKVAKKVLQEAGGDLEAALTRLVTQGHGAALDARAITAASSAAVVKEE